MCYDEIVGYVANVLRDKRADVELAIEFMTVRRYSFDTTYISSVVCDAIYDAGDGVIDVWSEYGKDEEDAFWDACNLLNW